MTGKLEKNAAIFSHVLHYPKVYLGQFSPTNRGTYPWAVSGLVTINRSGRVAVNVGLSNYGLFKKRHIPDLAI